MKKIINILSFFLAIMIVCNIFTISTFADPPYHSVASSISNNSNEITLNTYDAANFASTNSSTFIDESGGTLLLEYTGSPYEQNVITMYTKIIYYSPLESMVLLAASQSVDIEDFIIDQCIAFDTGVITDAIAKSIATYLGVSSAGVGFLVGLSVEFIIFMLDNMNAWEIENAINASDNSCVMSKTYIHLNLISATYTTVNCYEPWNDYEIEIPAYHDYAWVSGNFNCGTFENDCIHSYNPVIPAGADYHIKVCSICSHVEKTNHTLSNVLSSNEEGHVLGCVGCSYTTEKSHLCNWTPINAYQHKGVCTICSYVKTGIHSNNFDQLNGMCKTCGYTGVGMLTIDPTIRFCRE